MYLKSFEKIFNKSFFDSRQPLSNHFCFNISRWSPILFLSAPIFNKSFVDNNKIKNICHLKIRNEIKDLTKSYQYKEKNNEFKL